MREYVMIFVSVTLACGIVQMLVPEGRGGFKKYVGLVCGLCVLCTAIAPISSLLEDVWSLGETLFGITSSVTQDKDNYEKIYGESLIEAGGANMSSGLKTLISRDLGIDASYFDVSVRLREGEDSYLPDKATVILYGKAILCDPHEIIEYVNDLLSCECEVIYE